MKIRGGDKGDGREERRGEERRSEETMERRKGWRRGEDEKIIR